MITTSAYPAPGSNHFANSFQILSISVYYASGKADRGLLNEGQHRRVSIHHGLMNLADLLRAEVVAVRSPAPLREE